VVCGLPPQGGPEDHRPESRPLHLRCSTASVSPIFYIDPPSAFVAHVMPQNFLTCDRDQELLLPPNLRDWLPEDHLAWFVSTAVSEMDLSAFYNAYRRDGHGRAAHDPAMMVAPLLYASARVSAPREGSRRCAETVPDATPVVSRNCGPNSHRAARGRRQKHAQCTSSVRRLRVAAYMRRW
jgi:hypothetical protein